MKIMPMSETGVVRPFRPVLGLETIELLIGNLERDVGGAALDLGDARRCVGDELEDRGLDRRLAAPVVGIGLQADEGIALELLDHVGAGSDGGLLETFRTDLLVVGLGQDVAGEEAHPLEEGGFELLHVGGDAIAVDLEVADLGPHELDRVAGLGLAGALERPHDVFGREGRTVVPGDAALHIHDDLRAVVVPAPFLEQAGREAEGRDSAG